MFFLEDANGGIFSKENGVVDDLDFATMYETKEGAQKIATALGGSWVVMEECD